MTRKRFSKELALRVLDARSERIATEQRFDRSGGTSQLVRRDATQREQIDIQRAVEYGRMRAYEEFAEAIEEGFQFEPDASADQAMNGK